METLLLIDANSLIHRAFHALPPLISPDGRPIQALYGVASILLKLLREDPPEYAAACFDHPAPTFRKEEFAAYKAQRPRAPDALVSQIIEAHTLFEKFGVKTFEAAGYEADDLIATLREKFWREKDVRVVILTGDLDTLQLVEGKNVLVRTFRKGISDTFTYDEDAVEERFGLHPSQLTDYKALVGDPSDNIKGIPGVGPKTAGEWLKRFGNLERLFDHLQSDPKLQAKLGGSREIVKFFKQLVTLDRHAPIESGGLETLRLRKNADLRQYFLSLGFESLLRRLAPGESASEKTDEDESRPPDPPARAEEGGAVVFVHDATSVRELASSTLKVGFHLKQFLKTLWRRKKDCAPPYFDLGVAFWLLDPDIKQYEPPAVFRKFLRREWTGGAEDLRAAFDFARGKLMEYRVREVFETIEMPILRTLAEMEEWGVRVDTNRLSLLDAAIQKNIETLAKEIYRLTGEEFNLNSPKQVSRVLERIFPQKNHGNNRRTPGGQRSTSAETLLALKDRHPAIPLLLEYREGFKIHSTYVKPFQELVGKDGRLHTTFVQTGAATGRLSSQNPNLQNIPRDSRWARDLRASVTASPGFLFATFDYSQIELRILAALSRDPKMIEAFQNGEDIHRATAAKVYGVKAEEVTLEMRQLAKTLNFGLIYGMGAAAFARASGLSREEAQKFIRAYFEEFGNIRSWQEKIKSDVRTFGYVETPTGRRRYLPNIVSGSPRFVAEAERAAINHPIQGFAADIMKYAIIRTKAALHAKGWWGKEARLVLSIHDELLFEAREGIMKEIIPLIADAMEGVYRLEVPLRVDVALGTDWGNLKPQSL